MLGSGGGQREDDVEQRRLGAPVDVGAGGDVADLEGVAGAEEVLVVAELDAEAAGGDEDIVDGAGVELVLAKARVGGQAELEEAGAAGGGNQRTVADLAGQRIAGGTAEHDGAAGDVADEGGDLDAEGAGEAADDVDGRDGAAALDVADRGAADTRGVGEALDRQAAAAALGAQAASHDAVVAGLAAGAGTALHGGSTVLSAHPSVKADICPL
jgi:hypothetical protein